MAPMKRTASQTPPEFDGTLSIAEVAKRLKLSPKEVRRLLGQQKLGFVQIRGHFRIPAAELRRYEQQ